MNDLKEGFFGRVAAFVCVIEFQKRGLPHAHILLNLIEEDKITTAEEIDELVCAEIPDPDINPLCFEHKSIFFLYANAIPAGAK